MVPQRILQVPAWIGLAGLALYLFTGRAAHAGDDQKPSRIARLTAGVVDLRDGSNAGRAATRELFESVLASKGGPPLLQDVELRAALARLPSARALHDGRGALKAARAALSRGACATAEEQAEKAVLSLAAAQALGFTVRENLRDALVVRMLCADRDGEVDRAMSAARDLMRLGVKDRPAAISADVWARYPSLDAAANIMLTPVRVASPTPGAVVYIDFAPLDEVPSTSFLQEGEHIAAAAGAFDAVAKRVHSGPSTQQIELVAPTPTSGMNGLAGELEALRSGRRTSNGRTMAELMSAVEIDVAFVMRQTGSTEVWLWPGFQSARLVGTAATAREALQLLLDNMAIYDAPAPDPSLLPGLKMRDLEDSEDDSGDDGTSWWLYGGVIGAVVVATTFIVASSVSDDEQRIEVRF
jgi:hypothetical protein